MLDYPLVHWPLTAGSVVLATCHCYYSLSKRRLLKSGHAYCHSLFTSPKIQPNEIKIQLWIKLELKVNTQMTGWAVICFVGF